MATINNEMFLKKKQIHPEGEDPYHHVSKTEAQVCALLGVRPHGDVPFGIMSLTAGALLPAIPDPCPPASSGPET